MFKRFMYWAPWNLGSLLGAGKGCDEWHNNSVYILTPLGGFIFFYGKFNRDGEEHLWATFDGETEGQIVSDCSTCQELLEIFSN